MSEEPIIPKLLPNYDHKPISSLVIFTAVSPLISILLGGVLVSIIAPLVCWLIWKNQDPVVDIVGKNVLNGQISWTIYSLLSLTLCFVMIGFVIWPIVSLCWLIFSIVNAVKVANGKTFYVMPLTIRFLR